MASESKCANGWAGDVPAVKGDDSNPAFDPYRRVDRYGTMGWARQPWSEYARLAAMSLTVLPFKAFGAFRESPIVRPLCINFCRLVPTKSKRFEALSNASGRMVHHLRMRPEQHCPPMLPIVRQEHSLFIRIFEVIPQASLEHGVAFEGVQPPPLLLTS